MFGWDKSQVVIPAQLVLVCFALAVIFAGRVQDKIGPKWVATVGGVVLGIGLILAGMTQKFAGGLTWFVATFSVIGGIGIGMAYVCPISACVKWFPDKRGLITGLAVAGFGAGGLVFAPVAKSLIESNSVMHAITVLGVIFLVAVVVGAQFLSAPPAGYKPEGWNPPATTAAVTKADYTWGEMLATPQFYLLWLTYFAGCTAGLMIIMNASTIWQSFSASASAANSTIDSVVFDGIKTAGAAAVSTIAIFNAIGRIAWGKVSDSLGSRTKTLVIMFVLCAVAMLLLNRFTTYPLFIIGTGVIGFCFGGYLALYPAITADYYGTKNVGVNYGFMFTAYGAGGLFGPWLQARLVEKGALLNILKDGTVGGTFDIINYKTAFVVSGIMCVAAIVLTKMARAPRPKQPKENGPCCCS
jgi:OFA family oxalate/formate antiporter-like MFS transporter